MMQYNKIHTPLGLHFADRLPIPYTHHPMEWVLQSVLHSLIS